MDFTWLITTLMITDIVGDVYVMAVMFLLLIYAFISGNTT